MPEDNNNEEFSSKYTKGQRVFALIGVILLALLYLVTIVSALIATPATHTLFRVCLFCTILFPLLIWGYMLIGRLLSRH